MYWKKYFFSDDFFLKQIEFIENPSSLMVFENKNWKFVAYFIVRTSEYNSWMFLLECKLWLVPSILALSKLKNLRLVFIWSIFWLNYLNDFFIQKDDLRAVSFFQSYLQPKLKIFQRWLFLIRMNSSNTYIKFRKLMMARAQKFWKEQKSMDACCQ